LKAIRCRTVKGSFLLFDGLTLVFLTAPFGFGVGLALCALFRAFFAWVSSTGCTSAFGFLAVLLGADFFTVLFFTAFFLAGVGLGGFLLYAFLVSKTLSTLAKE